MKKIKVAALAVFAVLLAGVYYYPAYRQQAKWDDYFARTSAGKPCAILLTFLQSTEAQPLKVLDLGAGNGNDTIYLEGLGHQVWAVDFQQESIRRISDRLQSDRVHLIHSSFQDLQWQALPKFDVILANNSISFMPPEDFYPFWQKMQGHLTPGGYIVARLFGDQLQWPNKRGMTLLSRSELIKLSDGARVVSLEEELQNEADITQHAFSIILQLD